MEKVQKVRMPTQELVDRGQQIKDQALNVQNHMHSVLIANSNVQRLEEELAKANAERSRAKAQVDFEMTLLKRFMMSAALREDHHSCLNLAVTINWNYAADVFGIKKPKYMGKDKD